MSVTAPAGFRAAGVAAGLKPSGKPDVALVINDGPQYGAAAVFTSNRCKANPVLWSEQTIADGQLRAVVLNSGGANCYNGPEGFQTTHASAEFVADLVGCAAFDVAVCSTGLIGQPLDWPILKRGIDAAANALSADGGADAAEAIMTTDTVRKEAVTDMVGGCTVGGMAKGAAMLAPALATMLVVVTTDAVADAALLDEVLRASTRKTFDRLDTDGCMSTNDTVILMASGASGVQPDPKALTQAVTDVCAELAIKLWKDAEGAHHDIEIEVVGAASDSDAVEVGRAIARSNLFKAAVFGGDPNWGRVLAAVGTTSARFEPDEIDIAMNGVEVCRSGGTRPASPSEDVDMSGRRVHVKVDLHAGGVISDDVRDQGGDPIGHEVTIRTSDLTHDYVHENSAYST